MKGEISSWKKVSEYRYECAKTIDEFTYKCALKRSTVTETVWAVQVNNVELETETLRTVFGDLMSAIYCAEVLMLKDHIADEYL